MIAICVIFSLDFNSSKVLLKYQNRKVQSTNRIGKYQIIFSKLYQGFKQDLSYIMELKSNKNGLITIINKYILFSSICFEICLKIK